MEELEKNLSEIKKMMLLKKWKEMLEKTNLEYLDQKKATIQKASMQLTNFIDCLRHNQISEKIHVQPYKFISLLNQNSFSILSEQNDHIQSNFISEKLVWFNGDILYRHSSNNSYFSFCSIIPIYQDFIVEIKIIKMKKPGNITIGVSSYNLQMEYGRIGCEIGGEIIAIHSDNQTFLKGNKLHNSIQLHEGDSLIIQFIEKSLIFKIRSIELKFDKEISLPIFIAASIFSFDDQIQISSFNYLKP